MPTDTETAWVADHLAPLLQAAQHALRSDGARIPHGWGRRASNRDLANHNLFAARIKSYPGWLACEERDTGRVWGRLARQPDAALQEMRRTGSTRSVWFVRAQARIEGNVERYRRRVQRACWRGLGVVVCPVYEGWTPEWNPGTGADASFLETFRLLAGQAQARLEAQLGGGCWPDDEDPCTYKRVHSALAELMREAGWVREGGPKPRYPAFGDSCDTDGVWLHSELRNEDGEHRRLSIEIKRAADPWNPLAQVVEALGFADAAMGVRCAVPALARKLGGQTEMGDALASVRERWPVSFITVETGEAGPCDDPTCCASAT